MPVGVTHETEARLPEAMSFRMFELGALMFATSGPSTMCWIASSAQSPGEGAAPAW